MLGRSRVVRGGAGGDVGDAVADDGDGCAAMVRGLVELLAAAASETAPTTPNRGTNKGRIPKIVPDTSNAGKKSRIVYASPPVVPIPAPVPNVNATSVKSVFLFPLVVAATALFDIVIEITSVVMGGVRTARKSASLRNMAATQLVVASGGRRGGGRSGPC